MKTVFKTDYTAKAKSPVQFPGGKERLYAVLSDMTPSLARTLVAAMDQMLVDEFGDECRMKEAETDGIVSLILDPLRDAICATLNPDDKDEDADEYFKRVMRYHQDKERYRPCGVATALEVAA